MSEALASQVAAGEVVERPASVLKELIENSIDAGASVITVEIGRGGLSLLRVTDDGCGMSREDASLCVQRHATSKIKTLSDLMAISQLGFRGEALPSIASVSRFRLATREAGADEGTELIVEAGMPGPPKSSGVAQGTCVEIRDLFYNIPARRKFLKSEETEAAHAEHQVRLHALAFPHIRFILRRDDRLIYDRAPSTDWRIRIAQFSGNELAEKLIPVPETLGPGLAVSGYLLPISEARRSRKQQFIFLNHRPLDDPLIARAVRDGYSGFPTGLHPALYLNLEVEPSLVDVNVHPSKREVRFRRPNDVVSTLMRAISEAFAAEVRASRERPAPLPSQTFREPAPEKPAPSRPAAAKHTPPAAPTEKPGAGHSRVIPPAPRPSHTPAATSPSLPVRENKPAADAKPATPVEKTPPLPPAPRPPGPVVRPVAPASAVQTSRLRLEHAAKRENRTGLPGFRFLGHLHQRYFVWEGPEGLVLMNPSAARERILFERFLDARKGRAIPAQHLLVPVILELDIRDYDILNQLAPLFDEAGFRLQPFGRDTMQVETIPAFLSPEDARPFLLELVDRLSDNAFARRARALTYEAFAAELSSRMARRETCLPGSAEHLLEELLQCRLPYCTPGNKPTLFPFSLQELNRKFSAT